MIHRTATNLICGLALLSTVTLAQSVSVLSTYSIPAAGYGSNLTGNWESAGGLDIRVDVPLYENLFVGIGLEYGRQRKGRDYRTNMIMPSVRIGYQVQTESPVSFSPSLKMGVDAIQYVSENAYVIGSRRQAVSLEPGIEIGFRLVGEISILGQIAYHLVWDSHHGFDSVRYDAYYPRPILGKPATQFGYGIYRLGLRIPL